MGTTKTQVSPGTVKVSVRLSNNWDWLIINWTNNTKGSHTQTLWWNLHKEFANVSQDKMFFSGHFSTEKPMSVINKFVRKGWMVDSISDEWGA